MSAEYGSDLYRRFVAGREVQRYFRGLPWVVEAWEGEGGPRFTEMHEWCEDRLGPPRCPFGEHHRPGHWRSGNARVFGWAWWAFSSLEEAEAFLAAFPPPPEFVRSCERP